MRFIIIVNLPQEFLAMLWGQPSFCWCSGLPCSHLGLQEKRFCLSIQWPLMYQWPPLPKSGFYLFIAKRNADCKREPLSLARKISHGVRDNQSHLWVPAPSVCLNSILSAHVRCRHWAFALAAQPPNPLPVSRELPT